MGARGRKSASELEIVQDRVNEVNTRSIERMPAPASLTREERLEWDRITASQAAEWLTPGFDILLESYCRQAILERREAAIVDSILSADEFDEKAYERAATRLDRAARTKASLAIRLGFAHSTSYENKKTKPKSKKPWEFKG